MRRQSQFFTGFGMGSFLPRSLGQAPPVASVDPSGTLQAIGSAEDKLVMVSDWMQARAEYLTILGADAATFTQLWNDQSSLYPLVSQTKTSIEQGQANTLDSTDYGIAQKWVSDMGTLFDITTNHPETTPLPGAAAASAQTTGTASQAAPAASQPGSQPQFQPVGPGPVIPTSIRPGSPPTPFAASPVQTQGSTMILVGIGALAAIGFVWAIFFSE